MLQEIHAKYSSLHSWIDLYQKSIAGEDIFTDQKDGKEDRTKKDSIQKQKVEQKEAKKEQPTQHVTSDQTDQTTFSNQDTESNQKKDTKFFQRQRNNRKILRLQTPRHKKLNTALDCKISFMNPLL